jgi:CAAX prenyl protease N-terminal, five membrane helices
MIPSRAVALRLHPQPDQCRRYRFVQPRQASSTAPAPSLALRFRRCYRQSERLLVCGLLRRLVGTSRLSPMVCAGVRGASLTVSGAEYLRHSAALRIQIEPKRVSARPASHYSGRVAHNLGLSSGTRAGSRFGLAVAVAGATVAAQAAVWLLRPKRLIEPARVHESAYFTEAELERARGFARGQRVIALGALALEGAVLAFPVARPPQRGVRLAEQATRGRPLAASALVGAALVIVAGVVQLPLRAVARRRAINVGLATQPWRGWATDAAKGLAISAGFAAAGAALFTSLARRFQRMWWLVAAAALPAIEMVFAWLAPVLLAPIFNRFTELPQGESREHVLALAEKARVDVGGVFVVDASKRTSGTNAFVTGLGSTKRVVLYDHPARELHAGAGRARRRA